MDEKELVQKARSGDRDALEILLRDNYKIIYGYLLKLIMDEEAARDITQEVMVKAIMNIKSFRGDSKLSTWLISIASNIYRDSIRKRKIYSDAGLDDLNLKDPDSIEDKVINKDSLDRVKKVLMELPEEKRMAFLLKHFYSYSYEEIARILKCPLGTVRSRLHYCIQKLKDLIQE